MSAARSHGAVQRRARPFIFLMLLLLVGGFFAAAALIFVEWDRIELERGLARVTDVERVRPLNEATLRETTLTYLSAQGATTRPEWIAVRIGRTRVAERPTAQLADQIREIKAGKTATEPALIEIEAQAEVTHLGWTRRVRLAVAHNARLPPTLVAGGGARFEQGELAAIPDPFAGVPRKPGMIRPGMPELLDLLKRHRAGLKSTGGRSMTGPVRASLLTGIEALRGPLSRGELFWLGDPVPLLRYLGAIESVTNAPRPQAAWRLANLTGQALAEQLADRGLYTPPVDPSATRPPQ